MKNREIIKKYNKIFIIISNITIFSYSLSKNIIMSEFLENIIFF
jgi:hypothetical protein